MMQEIVMLRAISATIQIKDRETAVYWLEIGRYGQQFHSGNYG